SPGQTVFHWVEAGRVRGTLQLGAPARVAARVGVPVLHDLRSADVAAGGQGAPLVPAFDALLLDPAAGPRAALNLGGIANLTVVAPGAPVLGYDVGPANALLDAAAALPNVRVAFDHRLVGLDPLGGEMTFETPQGKVTATASVILGADGAGSAVRGQLLAYGGLTESLDFLDYGYKELTIPPLGGEFALDPGALHIWPRGTSMMIALPNPDRSFTCTLFWPTHGTRSFASLSSPAAIERFFATHYPDLVPLAPNLVDDYQHNPIGLLGTVRCTPWQVAGKVGLIGDAAHAIVPFYGQGANCAFEDVVELDRCLDECDDEWAAALPLFQHRRQDNAEAIARMALANFVEMRDKVASPVFRTRKQVEHALERALPGRY
ncbi:anhydro-N-acetylmuramic acid kinase, partial [Nocardia sp. NPDC003354]